MAIEKSNNFIDNNLALYLFNLALHLDNFFGGLGLRHTYNVNTSLDNGG